MGRPADVACVTAKNWTLPINIDQETAIARFRNFSMLSGLVRLTMFFL